MTTNQEISFLPFLLYFLFKIQRWASAVFCLHLYTGICVCVLMYCGISIISFIVAPLCFIQSGYGWEGQSLGHFIILVQVSTEL